VDPAPCCPAAWAAAAAESEVEFEVVAEELRRASRSRSDPSYLHNNRRLSVVTCRILVQAERYRNMYTVQALGPGIDRHMTYLTPHNSRSEIMRSKKSDWSAPCKHRSKRVCIRLLEHQQHAIPVLVQYALQADVTSRPVILLPPQVRKPTGATRLILAQQ
jgi:hypothetical protein